MEQIDKIKELFNNKEFVEKASKLESAQEVSNLFAQNDVDITPEELVKVKELVTKRLNGELSDEELEKVAGGELITGVLVFGIIAVSGGAAAGIGALMGW